MERNEKSLKGYNPFHLQSPTQEKSATINQSKTYKVTFVRKGLMDDYNSVASLRSGICKLILASLEEINKGFFDFNLVES